MRDQEIVVVVDGSRAPVREFLFAVDLARRLGIGSVRCWLIELTHGSPKMHILLPSGAGEQTLASGGCGLGVFDARSDRLDFRHEQASVIDGLRRSARAHGVAFCGYEPFAAQGENEVQDPHAERIVLVPWRLRDVDLRVCSRIWRALSARRASRIVFFPIPAAPIRRIIVDAGDAHLYSIWPWAHEWSQRLDVPLIRVSAERVGDRCFGQRPWLVRLLGWLGLNPSIRPAQCSLGMLREELEPTDLILTTAPEDSWVSPHLFGSRLSDFLADAPCALGILPLPGHNRLAAGDAFDDNSLQVPRSDDGPAGAFSLRGLVCGRKSSVPRS